MYFGPASDSERHCEKLGMPCPPHDHIADHLLDVAVESGKKTDALVKDLPPVTKAPRNLLKKLLSNGKSTAGDGIFVQHTEASFITQLFCVLRRSYRIFIRNPSLFQAHIILAIVVGLGLGALYYNIAPTLIGFQNRLGSFFFLQSLIAFGGLSAISSLAKDRLLFIRERSNGYYGYWPYLVSKVLFDIIPLRIIPVIIMCSLCYFLIGYTKTADAFLKFLGINIFFGISSGLHCLLIATMIQDQGTSILAAVMSNLFQMLFSGIAFNQNGQTGGGATIIQYFSFFRYAYEACISNEAAGFLVENNIGNGNNTVTIRATTLLKPFGFDAGAYWKDFGITVGITFGLAVLTGIFINYKLRELK